MSIPQDNLGDGPIDMDAVSPLPWSCDDNREGHEGLVMVFDAEGNPVMCFGDMEDCEWRDIQEARLVTTTVNAHAALEARVAALEAKVARLADLLQSIESASDEMSITRFGDYYAEVLSPIVRAELAEVSI